MKVYHVNRRDIYLKKQDGIYSNHRKYWGSIIIFEPEERTNKQYAYLLDVNGTVCHGLSKSTFQALMEDIPNAPHIYERGLCKQQWDYLKGIIKKMNLDDKRKAVKMLQQVSTNDVECPCGYMNLKIQQQCENCGWLLK